MKRFEKIVFLIAVAMILLSLYFRSARIVLSVTAGASIVILSFELLKFIISRAFGGRSKGLVIALAFLKLLLVGFILWFVVSRLPIDPPAFLAGLSTVVLAGIFYVFIDLIKRPAS